MEKVFLSNMPPFCMYGNLYFVGSSRVSVHLLDTEEGLVLIDAGYPSMYEQILDSIKKLGFDPKRICAIFHTHGHIDHYGCTLRLKAISGAKTYISRIDNDIVNGKLDLSWTRELHLDPIEPFDCDVLIEDGDVFHFGNTSIRCVLTPGHTPGVLSFFVSVPGEEGIKIAAMHGGVGLNTMKIEYLLKEGWPITNRERFRSGLRKLMTENVDLVMGNHPQQTHTAEKYQKVLKGESVLDPSEWREALLSFEKKLDKLLAEESPFAIGNALDDRKLPLLLSRNEMLAVLLREEYGKLPPAPTDVTFEVEENVVKRFCAGNAVADRVTLHCKVNGKAFSFPFYSVIPLKSGKHPFFVHINFSSEIANRYQPTEELIDNGFAVFSFCYNDITSDNGDFSNGLAGVLYENGERGADDPGKIAMWAWAAMRVMDYAQTLGHVLDLDAGAVCGHSRLGKTAMLTGALDERFQFVYSNNSGCSGDALSRGHAGERISDIVQRFPFWFCENYKKHVDRENDMPFDQHYLAASIAPRHLLVGAAAMDLWADPISQQLCCLAASPAFENGFTGNAFFARIDDAYLEGDIGFHLRSGRHYFSRTDWNRLISFIRLHQ